MAAHRLTAEENARAARARGASAGVSRPEQNALHRLQSMVGNRAVQRLVGGANQQSATAGPAQQQNQPNPALVAMMESAIIAPAEKAAGILEKTPWRKVAAADALEQSLDSLRPLALSYKGRDDFLERDLAVNFNGLLGLKRSLVPPPVAKIAPSIRTTAGVLREKANRLH